MQFDGRFTVVNRDVSTSAMHGREFPKMYCENKKASQKTGFYLNLVLLRGERMTIKKIN